MGAGRGVRVIAQLVGGVLVGLVVAEAAFWARDGGAFPHLNVYEPDDALAVRLRPGATQKVRYANNPVSTVSINGDGFRGAEWGPPIEGEIVVVGDSQVFGLGVDDDETMPAQLAALRGEPVRNAGVPTYGPLEYQAVIDRLLVRKPGAVVLVLNFSNDLFEIARPNLERHAVWDGWAVRKETAPLEISTFPGRSWLYNQSHAFYALRRWLHDPVAEYVGVASEGNWDEVALAAATEAELALEARTVSNQQAAVLVSRVNAALEERAQLTTATDQALIATLGYGNEDEAAILAAAGNTSPGDIVQAYGGSESSRSIPVTAEMLRTGARMRRASDQTLRAYRAAHPGEGLSMEIERILRDTQVSDAQLAVLAAKVADAIHARSPLSGTVARAKAACDAAGAMLVVVALPLDVQVSDTEWAKYGAEPQDMVQSRTLLADLVRDAHELGVRALDPTEAIAAVEPGAFLDADLHLTPKGHGAVAAALDGPGPLSRPRPGLPESRSRVPAPDEWILAREIGVPGSTKNHCSTRRLREWLRVACTPDPATADMPLGVRAVEAPGEAMMSSGAGWTDLVIPLLPGRNATVEFLWAGHRESLSIAWTGAEPDVRFSPSDSADSPAAPSAPSAAFAACVAERGPDDRFGAPDACAEFASDCSALVPCAHGERAPMPSCRGETVNAGSAGFCHALCSAEIPCATGECTEWQGTGVCL